MPTPLLILGTGLYARQVLEYAEDAGGFEIMGFVENLDRERTRTAIAGLPVLWFDDVLALAPTHLVINSIGTIRRRAYLEAAEAAGFRFATVVHPSARISRSARLGAGCVVGAGVMVGAATTIGRHVMLYSHSLVGHDSTIGDFVNVGAGSNLGGVTTIGDNTFLGMGTIVLERIRVGKGCILAAGSVVTRDVADRTEVRGVPARVAHEGIDPR